MSELQHHDGSILTVLNSLSRCCRQGARRYGGLLSPHARKAAKIHALTPPVNVVGDEVTPSGHTGSLSTGPQGSRPGAGHREKGEAMNLNNGTEGNRR